ncbi:MAG: hypothetical protein ABFS19_07535 [Thermodesulfobacteriota bacterium]
MTQIYKLYKTRCFFLLLAFIVQPEQAWAVQTHGAPEGLYVHQLAHMFYSATLGYLFWDLRRNALVSKGWRLLQVFCILMIVWNVVAFTDHTLAEFIDRQHLVTDSGYLSTRLMGPFSALKLGYYFTKLDHLFSVPALIFLFLSLRTLYRDTCREGEQ